MTTITICLSLIIIVWIICFTCYKCSGVKDLKEIINDIHRELRFIKHDVSFNNQLLGEVLKSIAPNYKEKKEE